MLIYYKWLRKYGFEILILNMTQGDKYTE